ncbi:GGDEF domain-containing protein [Halodesulfovibrio spirochaetisodalis]|uniref:diguanylate cyclase n=1 Tax=Halodesulfovibrio spirochaetisodalis TaxID=1560234 RepID=A0A1B7XA95_9BACT|nr:GGDEF domain-containing protein [Halodesulfovibrio spirochaetisodalis]OBQ46268.1 hypothetical protein SP90_13310 [Halodesulfovibrio spirochaetisodalis]
MFAIRELYAAFTITAILSTGILLWLYVSTLSTRGVLYWAAAMCSFSVGQLLIIFRGYVPFYISSIVAYDILLLGIFLLWLGVRNFLTLQISKKIYVFGLLSIIALTTLIYWFSVPAPNIAGRIGALNLMVLPYAIAITHNLLTNTKKYQSTWILGLATVVSSIIYITRIANAFSPLVFDNYVISGWNTVYAIWAITYLIIATASFVMMAIENKQQALSVLSHKDTLTGLFNLRAFNAMTTTQDNATISSSNSMGLFLVEIDDLDHINETYGDIVVDSLLKNTAVRLSNFLRAEDLIFRISHRRFLILSPNCPPAQTLQFAERIRLDIENSPLHIDDLTVPFTITIGCAASGASAYSVNSLYSQADSALNAAASRGINNTAMFAE